MTMSKYTTKVRYICEQKAGLTNSVGANSVDEVISKSWDKVVTTSCKFFDENYRKVLVSKVLKHYYLREICSETAGIWMMWMNTKFDEIMPYYNQLYESCNYEFNPLHDVDVSTTHTRTGKEVGSSSGNKNGSRNETGNMNSTSNSSATNNSTNRNLYSDTPQGALNGVENGDYLTDARKITNSSNANSSDRSNSNSNNTSSYSDNEKSNNEVNSTEDYIEHIVGKHGSDSYAKMLQDYRATLLNIDMQVIKEFEDLFMKIW